MTGASNRERVLEFIDVLYSGDVEGALARCLRVLIQVELHAPRKLDTHVYLRDAVSLRPDLHR